MQKRMTRKPVMLAATSEQTFDDASSPSDEHQSLRRTSRFREDLTHDTDRETITSSVRRASS